MLTLDTIEARAKALGWPTSHTTNPFDGPLLRVQTPSGYVAYGTDADGEVSIFDRETDLSPCRHDLAALKSPEPARPVVDPVTGLLPCPFCGGRVHYRDRFGEHIECEPCGLQFYAGEPGYTQAAWNRRTP